MTFIQKKALQSDCRFKIAAIGYNKKGERIFASTNKIRFDYKGGGIHAEMNVMLKAGPSLRLIEICRVNNNGKFLPIEPCTVCLNKAKQLGVKINGH